MKLKIECRRLRALVLMLCMAVGYAAAQDYQAVVRGIVTDENGDRVVGATITVKNESTGFSTGSVTNIDGEYIIKQVPLGSPYTVTATYIGYGEQRRTGYSLNQGDVLRLDFRMQEESVLIEAVQVVANSLRNTVSATGAMTSVTADDLKKLPVEGRNFATLIDLSPLSSGTSLNGQLSTSTNYVIDGMTAKGPTSGGSTTSRNDVPYAISMEAIREFKVVTNEYDVLNGRAGGGTISTVTKSGTNTLTGSAFLYTRADWLSSKYNINGTRRDNDFSTYQYGFSLGGPIVKDRAHFFIAWDHQADSRPKIIADLQSETDYVTYSLSPETRDRFLEIARSKYGVSDHDQFGSFDKTQRTDAVFARVDWQINATNLLSFTDNFVYDMNNMGLSDNSTINIYEVYGDVKSLNNSALITLRSVLGPKLTNELKVQHLYTLEESMPGKELPSENIPRAIVQRVYSTVNDNTVSTTIQLGGQRYSPENFYNHVLQLVDNFYYTTNKINYTFGADLMYTHMNSRYGSEANGRFYFTGLDNFEALTPYRYAREVYLESDPDKQRVKQNIMNIGVYGQLQTNLAPGLELVAGLRFDFANYFNHGNFSQLVYSELGLRTDNGMSTLHVQPRVQLTWDVKDRHKDIFKVGAGIFASDINNYAMINNMVFDGTRVMSLDIQDADLIPTPDFPSYRSDPSTAPGIDLVNDEAYADVVVPTINMNSKDCKVPIVYKANLSYTHFFSDRLKVSLSGYMTLARNNYMYVDRNMVDEPYFRIEAEDNRGVYVPASTISSSGEADWMEGRKSMQVGRVLEMVSKGKVNQFAFTIDGTWRYYRDGQISFSYTWNDSRDNTSYTGNVANSATLSQFVKDDPRDLSHMTHSMNQWRHKVVAYGSAPSFWGINVGLRFSGLGGKRFTMLVNGNVNGDFVSSNDLAFIYDPNDADTPSDIATGINTILNSSSVEKTVKRYIRKNFGKMARRSGGVNGFYGTFDLRVSKTFKTFKTQNLEVSFDIFNVANLLNKHWGVSRNFTYVYLYTITGFDQDELRYDYLVNTSAGVSSGSGDPFQIQVGLRYGF